MSNKLGCLFLIVRWHHTWLNTQLKHKIQFNSARWTTWLTRTGAQVKTKYVINSIKFLSLIINFKYITDYCHHYRHDHRRQHDEHNNHHHCRQYHDVLWENIVNILSTLFFLPRYKVSFWTCSHVCTSRLKNCIP